MVVGIAPPGLVDDLMARARWAPLQGSNGSPPTKEKPSPDESEKGLNFL